MTWKIDERMPWVLVVEMAAHIGAAIIERNGEMWIAIPEEENALQRLIDGFQARRAQRKRLVDDLK
jgi:hypothetical protein